MHCASQNATVFAADKSPVASVTKEHLTDCSSSGGVITSICISGEDPECTDGHTSATCRPLVDNPWSVEPEWIHENMGGFWDGTWSDGPVGTFGPSEKSKADQDSNLSMCKPGYVATALCIVGYSHVECLGLPDIAAAFKVAGPDAWTSEPLTFLKCGKLRQEQGGMISDMAESNA